MEKENQLEKLKEKYSKFQKKYNLPEFRKLDEDFPIENISEVETDFLLREIRKAMSEKLVSYLRFLENLLNPVNVPMFIYSIVKATGNGKKETLTKNYKKLAKLEIELIELELEYNEEKEANFIKKSFNDWQEIKKELLEIIKTVKENWDVKVTPNGKNYFG